MTRDHAAPAHCILLRSWMRTGAALSHRRRCNTARASFLTAHDAIRRFDSLNDLVPMCRRSAHRHSPPYEMDGLVIKVDDLATYASRVVGKDRAAREPSSWRMKRPPACST